MGIQSEVKDQGFTGAGSAYASISAIEQHY
jgi:hypothetical protein